MWPFKKKKVYRVTFKQYWFGREIMTESVQATDIGDAWNKVKKAHGFETISCESIQEVTGNEIN